MQYTPTLGTQVFVTKILEYLLTVPYQSGHLMGMLSLLRLYTKTF